MVIEEELYRSSLVCRFFMTDPVLPAPVTASGKPIGPGFRFHPTDEELITYYLKRKVEGKPMRFDVIREVNIYKHEPSDLAGSFSFSPHLSIGLFFLLFLFVC